MTDQVFFAIVGTALVAWGVYLYNRATIDPEPANQLSDDPILRATIPIETVRERRRNAWLAMGFGAFLLVFGAF